MFIALFVYASGRTAIFQTCIGTEYSKLNDVYRTVVEEWFPLTDSDLKDYSKQSYDLAIDIQELLFLLNSDKGEEWAISNFKLKLIKYYRSMEAWKEATDKLE